MIFETLRKRIGENVKFLGVVKADAYGHGSVQVSRLLQESGADYLAVSSIDEAVELRHNGITMPVLILGHTPKEEVSELIKNNITQAVTCRAKALEYSEEAVKCGGTLKIHIKVDTGMSRLGYLCDGDYFESGVEGICEGCTLPGLDAEGIFTHFAVSDEFGEEYESYTKHQFELFTSVIDEVEKKLGKKFKIRHCANTGAVARYPETWLDMVRPGLLLYGYGDFAQELGLKPVMSLKTIVSTIKTYPAGAAHTTEVDLTLDNVLRERRIELAFENKGYWDLIRRRDFHSEFDNRRKMALVPMIDLRGEKPQYIFVRKFVPGANSCTFQTHHYYRHIPGTSTNGLTQNPKH